PTHSPATSTWARTGTTAASTPKPKPAGWSTSSSGWATTSPSNPPPPRRPHHQLKRPDPRTHQPAPLHSAGCCRVPAQPVIFGSAPAVPGGAALGRENRAVTPGIAPGWAGGGFAVALPGWRWAPGGDVGFNLVLRARV